MKKRIVVLLSVMILSVSGCANQAVEKETQQQMTEQIEHSDMQVTEQHTPKAGAVTEELVETVVSETIAAEELEPQIEYITIQNPSEEYYIAEETDSDTQPYTLTVVEQKQNEIIDEEQWFEKNGVEKQFGDEAYSHEFWPYGDTQLVLHGPDKITEFDFSEFQYSSEYKKEDYDFIAQSITHTYVENNVLYVETGHWTYAASAPKTAYITAIDLTDYHVIWKSQPLVCNSRDFTIVGDVIFCGYGFTAEDDYLYQLDKKTGIVLAKEPLKSAPDHIIYHNDMLYVRTYNTDYVFTLE